MKCIPLEKAYESDYSLFSIIAFPQFWQNGKSYLIPESGRPDNGFMLILDCENTMVGEQGCINAKSGQIVYLPKGAKYEAFFDSSPNDGTFRGATTNYLFNFLATDPDGEEIVFSDKIRVFTPKSIASLCIMLEELSEKSKNAACPVALLKALGYEIITEISKQLRDSLYGREAVPIISRAVDYIGEHCLYEDVKISKLSEICHVSQATLRRLFLANLGISPKEYINSIRLKRALLLLSNGGVTVAEVSRLVGFDDPSYFSRFFKKHTGKNPTDCK